MNAILTYIAEMVVCSGLFIGFYRVALHQHAPFRIARLFLFFSLIAAAVIPALDIPVWKSAPIEITLTNIPVTTYETPVVTPAVDAAPDYWQYAVWGIYGIGIAALVTAMGMQAAWIRRIRRRSEIFRAGEYEVAFFAEERPSFSFFSTVYVGRETPPDEMRQIILHETSHIRHRHSAEKIVMEILKAIMWFNPFAWFASRLLSEVHEFEADRDVLGEGFTVEEYLPVIFKQVFGYTPEISAGLANSLTKKRFKMMTKNFKRGKYSWLRTAGVLPIAAGMLMLFGFTKQAPQVIMTEPEPEKTEVTVILHEATETCAEGETSETAKIVVRKIVVGGKEIRENDDATITVIKNGEPDGSVVVGANSVSFIAPNQAPNGSQTSIFRMNGIPADIFIWDNEQKREITKEELSAMPVDQIKGVSILKDGSYPDEIAQAIGDRKVAGVLIIGEIEGAASATTGSISQIMIDNATAATTGKISQVRITKSDNAQSNVIVSSQPVTNNSFTVKGEWSVGKKPIILVKENDGYREMPDNDFDKIDPNTIESISVLKDGNELYPAEVTKIIGDRKVNGVIIIELKIGKPETVVDNPDTQPQYPGGIAVLKKYIVDNAGTFDFPKNKEQMDFMFLFTIKSDGCVDNVEVVQSSNTRFSDKVVEILKSSAKWTPAEKDGKPVASTLRLPLSIWVQE